MAVAVLKEEIPLEIMLAHGALERNDRFIDQRIGLLQHSKRQAKGVLIAMEISIIKVGVFVEPQRQA